MSAMLTTPLMSSRQFLTLIKNANFVIRFIFALTTKKTGVGLCVVPTATETMGIPTRSIAAVS